ncbi:hypothetical protein ACIA8R_29680 [Nonomuraea sp. NPDC051191]|uniref:hypothetical protein n=1 Tax=Nonomuraea sp. NPDC051191 TaxID=3364372 RepID=UPI0037A1EE15
MSISAYISREGIKQVVGLLGAAPDDPYVNVDIIPTAVSGEEENPVSVYRAALMCGELVAREEIDYGARQGLFAVTYSFEGDDEGKVVAVKPVEEHDPDADRQTAREIVTELTERFNLDGDRYAKLGLTSDQVADLVRLGLAVCAASEDGNPLHWALDFFADPDALVRLGDATWHKLADPYQVIA